MKYKWNSQFIFSFFIWTSGRKFVHEYCPVWNLSSLEKCHEIYCAHIFGKYQLGFNETMKLMYLHLWLYIYLIYIYICINWRRRRNSVSHCCPTTEHFTNVSTRILSKYYIMIIYYKNFILTFFKVSIFKFKSKKKFTW